MIGSSIYVGAALLFSLVTVLALGAAMEAEGRWRRLMVPALYVLILLYSCTAPLIDGRDLYAPDMLASPSRVGKWLTRLVVFITLTVCVARLVAAAFSRENRGASGGGLLVAVGLFILTNIVLSSVFGTYPQFKHDQYYAPFLFAAVYASRTQDPETAIRFTKSGLFIFLAASCVTSVVAPELTIERNYPSLFPGVSIRFWGLETHANSMAPLALMYLLLAIHQPFERRWLQRLGMVMGVAVLVLAQSKTTWTAAVIAIPLLLTQRSRAWGPVAFSVLALGALVAVALMLLHPLGVSFEGILETKQGQDAAALDGRDLIWALAIKEWTHNPLFGYGLTMWKEGYRMQIGMDHAVSAHNQFLQSLSVAGAIGLIGLLVYVGALACYAIRAGRGSRGLSIALLMVVLLRCLTETPLSVEGFLGGGFVTHLFLFHIALAYGHRVVRTARPATSLMMAGRAS
jgi:exopolysaccharide production protein ExoQ